MCHTPGLGYTICFMTWPSRKTIKIIKSPSLLLQTPHHCQLPSPSLSQYLPFPLSPTVLQFLPNDPWDRPTPAIMVGTACQAHRLSCATLGHRFLPFILCHLCSHRDNPPASASPACCISSSVSSSAFFLQDSLRLYQPRAPSPLFCSPGCSQFHTHVSPRILSYSDLEALAEGVLYPLPKFNQV